jgi:pyrrolidone-carboxylate peptidase
VTRTVWRLVRVPEWPNRINVEMVVDTTADAVVAAIEEAAARNGIALERVANNDTHPTQPV